MDPGPASNDDHGTNTDNEPALHLDAGLNLDPGPDINDDPGMNMDNEPALHLDAGLNLDSGPNINDNPGMNMDNEPALLQSHSAASELPSSSAAVGTSSAAVGTSSVGVRVASNCINCRVDMRRLRVHPLEVVEVRSIVQQWLLPQRILVSSSDYVCHACWTAAWNEVRGQPGSPSSAIRHICVGCGHSLRRQRSHPLRGDSQRERMIRNIISEQIAPRLLQASDEICHPCWQRCNRAASRVRNPHTDNESTSSGTQDHHQPSDVPPAEAPAYPPQRVQLPTILLPNYMRAPDTQRRCFMPGCTESVRLAVPSALRVLLFCEYNYYVPPDCRICYAHLIGNSFEVLREIINPIHMFSAAHIEEFTSLLQQNMNVHLDFENINNMPEHIVFFYLGLSKAQFNELVNEVPRLSNKHRGVFALAAYLMKLRTGDSDERIASLLQIPRSTLERLMKMARNILKEDFVPRNLGINHISMVEIAQKNLIPNGLFGGEERHPIVIADGTYIYIEKSSNYLYQKQTYSLHKFRNLVKPFLLVCSNGYIIDVLGPYPATTSDAEIMLNEFSNENSPYREYFQIGTVFILDRGFRDSISLLESCNYTVHVPMSLQAGETQLSTINANKSRMVTMVRWVVETVNGIFKKSFKIFRQSYFNRASLHLMTDFRIAAALINRFHLRYTDRDDAQEILNVVNQNKFRNNDLADFVDARNLNRIRVTFTSITVQNNNVTEFPRLTMNELILLACGTYQIKQARSYYGEHVRSNGCYNIEVSNDRIRSLFEGSHFGSDCLLLRCRIQSRHVSRKTYFVYILLIRNATGRQAIQQYCCSCIVGRRTVGCCAHIMAVIWYLGWARHQDGIEPPAGFLDSVLLVYDDDSR